MSSEMSGKMKLEGTQIAFCVIFATFQKPLLASTCNVLLLLLIPTHTSVAGEPIDQIYGPEMSQTQFSHDKIILPKE